MPRTADHTIQGFLYQFNKTLLEILNSSDESEITVEGIIEDIDIANLAGITAIQCKYHETQEKFSLSVLYKPLLQMMQYYCNNPGHQINYILFAHFPNLANDDNSLIDKQALEKALSSTNKDYKTYINDIEGKIDLDNFLKCFRFELGSSFDDIVDEVFQALQKAGIEKSDIDTLAYPNAIHHIATMSANHDEKSRKITKQQLLKKLQTIKKTAISRWTLALKTRRQLLENKKRQLSQGLGINARLRYFVMFSKSLEDFDQEIVMFIDDYLKNYHHKTAHTQTPIFCLDTTEDDFQDIHSRLYDRGILCTDGTIANRFRETYFYRDPMIMKDPQKQIRREFLIRLLRWESHGYILNNHKANDLFVLGEGDYSSIEQQDINIEVLAATNLKEIQYMLGVKNVYE